MISLSGKVALVTGGSRGLGRAIALTLGSAGAEVVVTDLLVEGEAFDSEKLSAYSPLAGFFAGTDSVGTKSAAEEVKKKGFKSLALKMDVRDPEEIRNAISEIEKTLGTVDILVNNAAVMDNFALFENQDPDRWERDIRVNLTGAFHCSKAVWPGMLKKNWGRIINISSIAGAMGAFGQPSYGASKAGLIGLTRSLAIEGARKGITVNAVLPGLIETEAVKLHNPDMLDRMKNVTAMKRLGRPDEVASLVIFLASNQASYITGTAIPVAGGADLFTF
jgi:3-oxoacyl-[acyl-carrier protein] reductase